MRCERDFISGLANAKEEALAEGIKKGIKKGINEGIRERNLEIARRMIAEKLPLDQISRMLGLSMEQIMAIQTS